VLHFILLPLNLPFEVSDRILVFNLNQLLLVLFVIMNDLREDIIVASFNVIAHLKTFLKQSARYSSPIILSKSRAAGVDVKDGKVIQFILEAILFFQLSLIHGIL